MHLLYMHWQCSLEVSLSVTHSFYPTRQAMTCRFCDTSIKQPKPFHFQTTRLCKTLTIKSASSALKLQCSMQSDM
jgi:hypothetical protein